MSHHFLKLLNDETQIVDNNQAYLLQQQMRRNTILSIPLVKMSYNDYFIKKGSNILSVNLPDNSKSKEYEQMFKNRAMFQVQVQNFIKQDTTNDGQYCFYSWISNDDFCCQVPRQGVPLLATFIFSFQYEKAQKLIQKWPKTIITQTLTIFFKGFLNLIKIVESDLSLRKYFFSKTIFLKQSSQFLYYNYPATGLLLIGSESSYSSILQNYETLSQKMYCIVSNLNYLKQFLAYVPTEQFSDYYKLIFAFMANTQDQIQSKNIYQMLVNCRELSLMDRLNFAQKLIPFEQRKQFIRDFSKNIQNLTHLSNLFYFKSSQLQQIQKIIQNYLDEYGDLQSVAAVCLVYGLPELMGLVDMYQQILVISCEDKKAQALQNQQDQLSFCLKKVQYAEPISKMFLSSVNFQQQKIDKSPTFGKAQDKLQHKHSDHKTCYVCFRNQQKSNDLFVQCGRCRHGGHLSHLLKWYEESNNICPKTDCPCYCI